MNEKKSIEKYLVICEDCHKVQPASHVVGFTGESFYDKCCVFCGGICNVHKIPSNKAEKLNEKKLIETVASLVDVITTQFPDALLPCYTLEELTMIGHELQELLNNKEPVPGKTLVLEAPEKKKSLMDVVGVCRDCGKEQPMHRVKYIGYAPVITFSERCVFCNDVCIVKEK